MNKQKIGNVLGIIGALVLAAAFFFWLGVPNRKDEFLLPAIIITVIGVAMCVVGGVLMFTKSKNFKYRKERYALYPARTISDFNAELQKVRENFASDTNPKKNRVIKVTYPNFKPNYDYDILTSGKICYAQLVEANNKLFKDGADLADPAVVIFSTDEYYAQNPLALKRISESVYANRRNNILRNERESFFNVKLPDALTEGRAVYMTTLAIYRENLPLGYLSGSIFPVIADPENSTAIFVVDAKYWTDDLIGNFVHGEI